MEILPVQFNICAYDHLRHRISWIGRQYRNSTFLFGSHILRCYCHKRCTPGILGFYVLRIPIHLSGIRDVVYRFVWCQHTMWSSRIFEIEPISQPGVWWVLESLHRSCTGRINEKPDATSDCLFCSVSKTDSFLAAIGSHLDDAWRNFGLMWKYIAFNILGAMFIHWLVRLPKGKQPLGAIWDMCVQKALRLWCLVAKFTARLAQGEKWPNKKSFLARMLTPENSALQARPLIDSTPPDIESTSIRINDFCQYT